MRKTSKKGQIELVFVVVLVIIGIVAAYTFLNFSTVDSDISNVGLSDEAKVIKDSVMNLAKNGLVEKLKLIYMQGGYANSTNKSIKLGIHNVEILCDSGELRTLDFKKELEEQLKEYMRSTLEEEMDFYGKETLFNFEYFDVNIYITKGAINAEINLPTKVNGNSISQPYKITVPSDLYDIMEFSNDVLFYQNTTRFFDFNIIDAMARSNPQSEYWVPLSGIVTGCENAYFRDKERLVTSFEKLIRYSTSHTISTKTEDKKPDPYYNTNISYRGLDVAFIYPQWDLRNNFEAFPPNPALSIPRRLSSLSSYCLAYYNMSYSFRYPLIIYSKDEQLGEWFRFAIMVNIRDNMPVDEKIQIKSDIEDYYELCDKKAKCPVKVRVVDSMQNPLSGAVVLFDECVIDTTDFYGIAEGFAPCYAGELIIRKEGKDIFSGFVKSDDLKSVQAVLPAKRDVKIHLYGVPLNTGTPKGGGYYSSYSVAENPTPIDEFENDFLVAVDIFPTNEMLAESYLLLNTKLGEITDYIEFEGLPKGEFNFVVTITENETGLNYGYSQFIFASKGTEEELYLYLPIVTGGYEYKRRSESIAPNEILKLTNALIGSKIEPISEEVQE